MMNIYIANLRAYNEGRCEGTWLSLPATEEQIDEALIKIGVAKNIDGTVVVDIDYRIDDYETSYNFLKVDQYESPYKLNELIEQLEAIDSYDMERLATYMDINGGDIREALDAEVYEYRMFFHIGNSWNVEHDAAHVIIDEIYGGIDQLDDSILERYFDVEYFGRELQWDFEQITEGMDEDDVAELSAMYDAEFGQWYIDSLGSVKELGRYTLENYFDYESYGRDLMMDYSYSRETGYIMSDY